MDFEYQYWEKDYDAGTSDYSANQAKLIFKKQLRIFEFEAGAGYQNRDFDESGLDDIDVFTYHLNFDGEGTLANRRTYISLNAEQNFNDHMNEVERLMEEENVKRFYERVCNPNQSHNML